LPEAENADLDLIGGAAREAASIAMRYFRKNPETWLKEDDSPVTEADIAVDRFLRDALTSARPDYGWLSEETADNPERLSARRTFVVDPIDGTRAFIGGLSQWCVSIAVVEAGRPVAGVLDCPAQGEVYCAGASTVATRNGEAIHVAASSGAHKVAGPRTLIDRVPDELRRAFEKVPYIPSLAYRLALVASGAIDATFVKANARDWDLAAADLILLRAGGRILGESMAQPLYARKTTAHGVLVAGSAGLLESLVSTIRRA
jgi:myo-inositol-1(or 4)-monophosphatase